MNGRFGAIPAERGYRFTLWAPAAASVELVVRRGQLPASSYQLPAGSSLREITVEDAHPGDRYAYILDGKGPLPDPASRYQPDGVHGWSEIVDPRTFAWTDNGWRGLDPRRAVIYELHVGTFTPAGTFRGAIDRLPHLRDLGVTAIELMPLADFAGRRNWGYDGVALFAPSRAYGTPDDLRAFVDAAHAHGLAVLIDVVYNHLGPEGAYLPAFAPDFLTSAHTTPWGDAVNLDGPGSHGVRALLIDNAVHWIREYHADGLRLDATHSLIDGTTPHFVADVARAARAESSGRALVYAEDFRNLSTIVGDAPHGGWGLDGLWADDFHHVVRRMVAGDGYGYYQDYEGSATELATILRDGWLFTGQHSRHLGHARGTDPSCVPLRKSVVCIQNHDQIGNRALGDRLHHRVEPAAWRAAVVLLLTAPMTPLLFMGQEWSSSAPFQFFTDFEPRLGAEVVAGRRREFATFPEFAGVLAAAVPSPQIDSTFEASRLRWDERDRGEHAGVLALHRALLHLRSACEALQGSDERTCDARAVDDDTVVFHRGPDLLVVARLRGSGPVHVDALSSSWRPLLTSEDAAYAIDARPPTIERGHIQFEGPAAILFQRTPA